MDKGGGHIDIVFRDGLKNLEILPPPDIWDNISAEVTVSKTRGISFRVAAGIAAIISLGLLSYFIGSRTSDSLLQPLTADNPQEVIFESEQTEPTQEPVLAEAVITDNIESISEPSSISGDVVRESETSGTEPVNAIEQADISLFINSVNNTIKPGIIESNQGEVINSVNTQSSSLVGVDFEPSVKKSDKWMLGAKMSPTYLSTNLKAANSSISGSSSNESAVISYTGGLTVSYSMGGRLSLQTGLLYSSLGRQISGINSYSGFAGMSDAKGGKIFGVETSSGEIASTNQDIFLSDASSDRISSIYSIDNFDPAKSDLEPFGNSLRQNFEYLEIPLILSYKIIDRKLDFNILGGMSYNFLINNSTFAVADGSKVEIGSTQDVTPLLLSSALGMSMEYSLNSRFSLNLEPSFRYYLNSDGRFTTSNPFTFGLFSGLYYKF